MGDAAKWWEKVEEETTIWRACLTEDGLEYYYNTETNETQWEKPEELMTDEEINQSGKWRWVPHDTEVFVPALQVSEPSRGRVDVQYQDGTQGTVKEKDCAPFSKASLSRLVPDLTLLDDMSTSLILHNLKSRFQKREIYTNVGNILISVNPYERLPLYTKDVVRKYTSRKLGQEMPPHVFNIAHDAYYGITAFKENQSIIISGESGAGKTEATKQCLQYIAAIAGSISNVENKILMANPLLEAFGNAKTLRNDNSSRFGKYIEIYFADGGRILGSTTENYLLEKIRVVQPATGERNFHIFYQLAKSCPDDMRKDFQLRSNAAEYYYLRSCVDVDTIDDAQDFAEVRQAVKDLNFKADEERGLYSVVAAVMALGNVEFVETKPDQAAVAPKSKDWLATAASILKVDSDVLGEKLVTRELRIMNQEATICAQDMKQASDSRHALCKFAYAKMFDWLVQRVNQSMEESSGKVKGKGLLTAGILDIFGFEIFKHNSFEQLCINFTNEMLQQHFNNNTFKLEEQIYVSEGIKWTHIDFIDNQPMIELITAKRDGILSILDEELIVPRGSDAGFLEKLGDKQGHNKVYKRNMKKPDHFIVRHYAGDVSYDGNGFLEKNRDTLTQDIIEMLQSSQNKFINMLYPPEMTLSAKDKKSSLSKQFQQQLNNLMKRLYATQPHYIRCIKPNEEKAAMKFVPRNCYEQLTYSGVFEAVAIRKQGFPFRLSHGDFAERYGKLCTPKAEGPPKKVATAVCKHMKLKEENVQIGNSRVLYRAMEYRNLELHWSIATKNETIDNNLKKLTAQLKDTSGMSKDEKERAIIELADAIREADKFRVKTKIAEQARSMLDRFIEERVPDKVRKQLKRAHDSKDKALITDVLEICEREGWIIKLVRDCRMLLEKIDDAEAALAMATREMQEEYLERALAMCDEFGYKAKVVQAARKLLSDIRKAKSAITKAMASPFNHTWLSQAVKFCSDIGYTASNTPYTALKTLAQKVLNARKQLEEAIKALDEGTLATAIHACNAKDFNGESYTCELLTEAQRVYKVVKRINENCDAAIRECREDQVRLVVSEAKKVGMRNSRIDQLRKLVNGPYDKFLQEQFKRAKKCKHHPRAIRVSIKLKDMEIEKRGAELSLARYSRMKQPMEWSSEKFTFGSTSKRAENMCRWQKEHLHAPLTMPPMGGMDTRLPPKEVAKKVIHAFDTVQKYMGQRNTRNMPLRLFEMCSDAVTVPYIRDEIYVAIIKQCTDNPNAGSMEPAGDPIPRAFELLALCLCVFPPSEPLEDFVEYFLRRPHLKQHEERWYCRGLLRRVAYHGAISLTAIPQQADFQASCLYDTNWYRKYKSGALDGVLNARLKLKELKEADGEGGAGKGKKSKPSTKPRSKKSSKSSGAKKPEAAPRPKKKKSAAAEPAAAAAAGTLWQAVVDPNSGHTYYFNTQTQEVTWTKPAEGVSEA